MRHGATAGPQQLCVLRECRRHRARTGADTYLSDLLTGVDDLGVVLEVVKHEGDGLIDAAFEVHGVHASGDTHAALSVDGLGQHGGGGGAIAGQVVGLAGNLAHKLGAEVLELVLEVDAAGHSDTILGDLGRAVGLLNDDVTSLGAKSGLHGVGNLVDTSQHGAAGLSAELDVLAVGHRPAENLGSHGHIEN